MRAKIITPSGIIEQVDAPAAEIERLASTPGNVVKLKPDAADREIANVHYADPADTEGYWPVHPLSSCAPDGRCVRGEPKKKYQPTIARPFYHGDLSNPVAKA